MIYLDHAATSFPKPDAVLEAVTRWFRELGVSATRGDSDACRAVAREVGRVRTRLGRECGVPASRIAFCSGATEGLNLTFAGMLPERARVLTTSFEHSSVIRPLVALRDRGAVEVERLTPDEDGALAPEQLRRTLQSQRFDAFVFTTASNISGRVYDAAGLAAVAREHGCPTICDASQTAGLLPLDVGADVVLASTHKSMLGPPGLGFLAVRPDTDLRPTKLGGTGSSIALETHPDTWPECMEPGTPNTPAIFGLAAALDWLEEHGNPLQHGLDLCDLFRETLGDRIDVLQPGAERIPILSFTVPGLDPSEVGAILADHDVHVRTGFHCAPWAHDAFGTSDTGVVRVSPGPFVSADDVRRVCEILAS